MTNPIIPPIVGLDEAWAKVDPIEARKASIDFIIGYISEDDTGKNLTPDDVARIHAAGLPIVLNFEYNPQSAVGGRFTGTQDATIAVQKAKALGAPPGTVIYFSIDFPVGSNSALATIGEYILAASAVCIGAHYIADAYGGIAVISYLLDQHLIGYGWQTYAWSNGQWDSRAALRQVANGVSIAGANVDRDLAVRLDYGQWRPDGSVGDISTPGGGNPLPTNGFGLEDDPMLFLINVHLPDGANLDGVVDGQGYWHYLPTGDSLIAASAVYGPVKWDGPVAVARDAFSVPLDDNGKRTDQAPQAPAPAPVPAPVTPTAPEQQLLDLWGRIAKALEEIAGDLTTTIGPTPTPPVPHQAAEIPTTVTTPGTATTPPPVVVTPGAAGTAPADTQP